MGHGWYALTEQALDSEPRYINVLLEVKSFYVNTDPA
jgi:hypothetical protein